ncbi:MAG: tRNA 2-thiouridine(34) synthase MnmA, partial [Planctomycetes bacterium]|nr:tRNA 2-thiouridine(34) synthase MnmA [Planctomycetota bacterium]
MGTRIVVAMSGGVDSSVAAHLLREQGYEVIGLFMRMGVSAEAPDAPTGRTCCSAADAFDARRVAASLGIPFYVLNFEQQFRAIMDYFCAEYGRGRTPNPCIRCNEWLKFGRLLEFAKSLDAPFVATGHYARVERVAVGAIHESPLPTGDAPRLGRVGERFVLKKGLDPSKDQSYVLFPLKQPQLASALFPVGSLTKKQVREIARKLDLRVKDKPDSQEICFVPDDNYRRLILERSGQPLRPGLIKDTTGKVLGQHPGIQFFTIGQRRGLGIATGKRRYVVRIDPVENVVIVGSYADALKREFIASDLNWIAIDRLDKPLSV